MNDASTRSSTLERVGLVVAALFVLGPLLAWLRVLPGMAGFGIYALAGLGSVVLGLSALVASARGRDVGLGRGLSLLAGMVFVVTASAGAGVPRINDFTTSTSDPPRFLKIAVLAPNQGRDMSYPATYAADQQACCGDLRPARLSVSPAEAFTLAKRAAEENGWEIVSAEPDQGTIEAVATTAVFGFHDDIAIRVSPDGAGSQIDIRSKSRDGKGDMGANADRIRAYVTRLEAAR